jgi:hypothetical protein
MCPARVVLTHGPARDRRLLLALFALERRRKAKLVELLRHG